MKKNNVLNQKLYLNIQTIIESSKNAVSRAVNSAMVRAYWEIGRLIFEEEQKGKSRADYGSYIIESLSKQLIKDYGKGFSEGNLRQMRQFHNRFPIRQTVSDELAWSHYLILSRIEDKKTRQFYMKECVAAKWSVRELERQVASLLYERLSLSKNKKQALALSQKGHEISQPSDLVKDPYVLEFLGLKKESVLYEKKLETALIEHLQDFLLELGKGFSFVGRQQRITIGRDHFYVDLVFYNRIAKSFVLIDLKLGKLTHQDIGQMQMYLNYYKRTQKIQGENDPIGILLCSDKNDTVVEFTLPEGKQEIFASKYKLTLPSKKELKVEIQKERKLLENYSRKVSK
jgi:predicted nuclease of restriction endonuclease-like (RecB) superfamily